MQCCLCHPAGEEAIEITMKMFFGEQIIPGCSVGPKQFLPPRATQHLGVLITRGYKEYF